MRQRRYGRGVVATASRSSSLRSISPVNRSCSDPECQLRRRADNRRQKIASDSEYRQVCQDSCRKRRSRHPDYWRQRRESNPAVAERNRQQQRVRDQKRRLRDLANNNSAFDLKHSAAQVWLVGSGLEQLANNNSVRAQVWVLEAVPLRHGPQVESTCPSVGRSAKSTEQITERRESQHKALPS